MKKSIKNRGVLLKMVLATMVYVLIVATLIAFVGCTNGNYDNNSLTIEFGKKQTKFTLPKDAFLSVEKQTKYYVFENVKPKSKKVIEDLIQYVYDNTDSNKKVFRVEKDGSITKAGYFEEQGKFEISLDGKQNVYKRENYITNNLPRGLSGVEDLMLTNIGNNYFKVLDIDEKFALNLYRNNMIIDSATGNVQIEPKFEIEVMHGDSVRIERKRENKFDVVGVKSGVTQVKIKYQAIDVLSGGKWFCYNASNENREVIANFAVGEDFVEDVDIKLVSDLYEGKNKAFDSEFDTIYYQEENRNIKVQINGASSVLCQGKAVPKICENIFELQIKNGANVLEIVKGNKRQFVTIYGAKISIDIQNENGEITSDNKIQVGDNIKIKVNGIYNTLPKMSGVYNPTQQYLSSATPTYGCKLQVVFGNGEEKTIIDAKYISQYYYKENSEIEFEMKSEYLQNGKFMFDLQFYAKWWGENLGAHRDINDSGVQTNMDAKLYDGYIGFFEQISIE